MSDTIDVITFLMDKDFELMKQSDNQRTSITGIILIIASAIQGGLTQTGFVKSALVLTILLIILGLFGTIAILKLYENAISYYERYRKFREQLDELCPEANIMITILDAKNDYKLKYSLVSKRIHRHQIWAGLHMSIIIIGIIYTLIILLK